jgi:2-polyprenyl-3-methyl-5-hydroxy-6-metoxy-1,4-benzoquinol methylase
VELAEFWSTTAEEVRDVYRRYNVDAVQRPPPFQTSTVKEIFDSYTEPTRLEKDMSRLMLHYHRFGQAFDLLRALALRPDLPAFPHMVDYGCGVSDYGLAFGLHGFAVTLVDLAGRCLDFAASRYRRRGLSCTVIEVRPDDEYPELPTADVVVAGDVLEHLRDPRIVIANVARSLSPRGYFWFPDFPFKEKSIGGAHLESAAMLREAAADLVGRHFARGGRLKHLMQRRPSA